MNNFLALPKKIAILHSDAKKEYFSTYQQYLTEKNAVSDAQAVAKYLTQMKIRSVLLPANTDLPAKLKEEKPDMAINLVGSIKGNEYLSATIPALLELLEIPYTGSGILGESLTYNKFIVKKLQEQHGIPVPHYQLFNSHTEPLNSTLRFPLIAKLNEIHGAVELTRDAISETEVHLKKRIKYLIETYQQDVLVEEFIVGREITIHLLEGLKKKIYMAEKVFRDKDKYAFADFESQWISKDTEIFTYHKFKDPILMEYVKKAFQILKMDDYAKFDVRIDSSNRYYFLDSNSNPFFGPKEVDSSMACVLELYGVSFNGILKRLIQNTIK